MHPAGERVQATVVTSGEDLDWFLVVDQCKWVDFKTTECRVNKSVIVNARYFREGISA